MADIFLVATLLAFIGLCIAYVAWCDRIIGPDPVPGSASQEGEEPVEVRA